MQLHRIHSSGQIMGTSKNNNANYHQLGIGCVPVSIHIGLIVSHSTLKMSLAQLYREDDDFLLSTW